MDFKKAIINEETAVRLMVYEIRDRNPEAVKFVPKTTDIKSILLHMKTRKYDTLMYLYGYKFLLEVLNLFEKNENYEECSHIVKQIERHNTLVNEKIPTKWKQQI